MQVGQHMPVPRGNPWLVSMRGTVHGVVLPGGISPGKGVGAKLFAPRRQGVALRGRNRGGSGIGGEGKKPTVTEADSRPGLDIEFLYIVVLKRFLENSDHITRVKPPFRMLYLLHEMTACRPLQLLDTVVNFKEAKAVRTCVDGKLSFRGARQRVFTGFIVVVFFGAGGFRLDA